ncbi:sensor histidine kinase [Phaeovulum sp. W22_SRMD_FR3]|uniref:sensor histidine kinase n=1 Tax=Phaeovulum sp. W22_SRMD_FR3 TaxID=3240274 RepID=UPI003F9BFAAF
MSSRAQPLASQLPKTSLTSGVMVAAALLMLLATVLIDKWVADRVTHAILLRNAGPFGTYMNQYIAPLTAGIETDLRASPEKIAQLDQAADDLNMRQNVVAMRIWRPSGQIYYASDHREIDTWLNTAEIAAALNGQIYGYFDDHDDTAAAPHESDGPIYEIYVPLRSETSDKIIAVEEFHFDGTDLSAQIALARIDTWRVTGSISLMILGALFLLVRQGDKMLIAQRRELEALQAGQLAFQKANQALQAQIEASQEDLAEVDQRVQRRVGIELHDGPAQLLTYILLRMDEIEADQTRRGKPRAQAGALVESVRQAAAQALSDLTRVSKGLFLQESDAQNTLCGSLRRIVEVHEKRSGTQVDCTGIDGLPELPAQTLLCAAQLLREALTNGHKHAPGATQRVQAELSNGMLLLTIEDSGPGIPAAVLDGQSSGLGLQGMRYHVEALGGTMIIASAPGQGTQLRFLLPLEPSAAPAPQAGRTEVPPGAGLA